MPSNNANGNAIDPMGNIVTCEQSTHRVVRAVGNVVTPIAATYMGKSFNSPNDVIVRADANIYFTDPDYAVNPADRQPFQGVFRVDPSANVSLVASDMSEPNGIALSPDETLLYVDDTTANHVNVFTLATDGTAANPQMFVSTSGTPDGMAIDDAGNLRKTLYVTARKGLYSIALNVPGKP